jgi:hypothetical protein
MMTTPITPHQDSAKKNSNGKFDAAAANKESGTPLKDGSRNSAKEGLNEGANNGAKEEVKETSKDSAKPPVVEPKKQMDSASKY